MTADFGMIGLAVMGENLTLNILDKGFSVAVYDINTKAVDAFVNGRGAGKAVVPAYTPEQLVANIARPRRIMLLIRAGSPVDETIEKLAPLLDRGDVMIDGGNSHFPDTQRRMESLEKYGIGYIGTGVSGGGEGALKGPSLMPGGSPDAWPLVRPVFERICAHTEAGESCCRWVGEGGAGHFVKMVHNGIEYGDMQLICEAYGIMRNCLGMSCDEAAEVFEEWNRGELRSYLIEITADILRRRDSDGEPLVDKILDRAGQKGTGKWAVEAALDEGTALTLIGEAVFARCLSAAKDERVRAAAVLGGEYARFDGDRGAFLEDLRRALYAAKLVSYAQGFMLMRSAAASHGWNIAYGDVALMWRGGCIIRSAFLEEISRAFSQNPGLENLMLDKFFADVLRGAAGGWRRVCAQTVICGYPAPAFLSALSFFDGYRSERLPADLLQAQRDYFGAHTYERVDSPRGSYFHTDWTGDGGVASTTYSV